MFTMQNIHSLKWSQLYSCKTKLLVSSSILHDIHLNPPLKKVKKKKKKKTKHTKDNTNEFLPYLQLTAIEILQEILV